MPKRVLLDNQIFTLQSRGGISRYFVELLRHRQAAAGQFDLELRLGATLNEHLGVFEEFDGLYMQAETDSDRDELLRGRFLELGRLAPAGFQSADLLHHTYYDPAVLQATRGATRVCTLYDMIPELRPELFQSNPHLAKRQYFEHSELIISVSQAAADDMLNCWPDLASSEIAIVPLGVSSAFTSDGRRHQQPRPYLLFVGTRGLYKNFDLLLRTLATAGPGLADLDIVAVGNPLSAAEEARITELGLQSRVRQVKASDAELAEMYRGAFAFIFPSLHEGFGLPVLEAMACGCPTILSDTPVFREVGEDAALFFDPASAEALANAVMSVDRGPEAQMRVQRGLSLAARRTWDEVVARTGRAYSLVA